MRASTVVAILSLAAGAAPSVASPLPIMKSGGAGVNLNKPRTLSPHLHLPSPPPSTPPLLPRDPSGHPMGSPLPPRPHTAPVSFQSLQHSASSPYSGVPVGPPLRPYMSVPSFQSLHPTSPPDYYTPSLSPPSPYTPPPPSTHPPPPLPPPHHITDPSGHPMGSPLPPRPHTAPVSFQSLQHSASSPYSGVPVGPPLRSYMSVPSFQSLHPTSPPDYYTPSLSPPSPYTPPPPSTHPPPPLPPPHHITDPSGHPMGSPLPPRPHTAPVSFQSLQHSASSPYSGVPVGPPLRPYMSVPSFQSLHPTSPPDYYTPSLSPPSPYTPPPPSTHPPPPLPPPHHITDPSGHPMGSPLPPRPHTAPVSFQSLQHSASSPYSGVPVGPPLRPYLSVPSFQSLHPTSPPDYYTPSLSPPSPYTHPPPSTHPHPPPPSSHHITSTFTSTPPTQPLSPVTLDSDSESYIHPNPNLKNLERELLDQRIELTARTYVRELPTASMVDLD